MNTTRTKSKLAPESESERALRLASLAARRAVDAANQAFEDRDAGRITSEACDAIYDARLVAEGEWNRLRLAAIGVTL